jgi:hypothetical protein
MQGNMIFRAFVILCRFSTLKMEATFGSLYQTSWHNNPDDYNININSRENLEIYIYIYINKDVDEICGLITSDKSNIIS